MFLCSLACSKGVSESVLESVDNFSGNVKTAGFYLNFRHIEQLYHEALGCLNVSFGELCGTGS